MNHLATLQDCWMGNDMIVDVRHANHIWPKRLQGVFKYYKMDCQSPTKTRLKMYTLWKIKHIQTLQVLNIVFLFHTQ